MPKVILDVKFYSVKEIADLLGVTATTARQYIKDGKIEAKKIANKIYVTEEQLRKFLID